MITFTLFMWWVIGMSFFSAYAILFGTIALILGVFVLIDFIEMWRGKKK